MALRALQVQAPVSLGVVPLLMRAGPLWAAMSYAAVARAVALHDALITLVLRPLIVARPIAKNDTVESYLNAIRQVCIFCVKTAQYVSRFCSF
jgi:hypothetical protein